MKNHKIKFFFSYNKVEEKKITKEELIHLLSFKNIYIYIYIGVYTAFIVFMIINV